MQRQKTRTPDDPTLESFFSLERFAQTLACLEHFRPEQSPEALARLGVEQAIWEEANRRWTDALQLIGRSVDALLAEEFTSSFMRKRKELRDTMPRLKKLGPLPVAPREPEPAPKLVSEGAVESGAATATPSYLRPPTPVPAPPPPDPPAPQRRSTGFTTGTEEIDLAKVLKASVPFDPTAPSQLPPAARANEERPPKRSGKTMVLSATPDVNAEPTANTKTPTGRLVRFDPQTGAPLAVPYWEELPKTNKP